VGLRLFILPGALFAGAAVVLNTPVLWAGTALKLFDISLKQSVNKAATELVIMPIPMAIKGQVKTFIDVFVDATATGVGGLMLIFLINGFNLSVRAVCIMILVFICIWIFFVFRVRKEYVRVFQDKLGLRQTPKKKDLHADHAEIGEIRHTLQFGSTKRILSLLEDIMKSKDPRLIRETFPLLTHRSVKIRQAVLRCLYYHTDPSMISQIEPLLKDPDDEVRFRAFSCLLVHSHHSRVGFINDYLNDKDPAISGAAFVGLATEARDNPELQKQFNLEQILLDKIKLIGLLQDKEEEKTAKITVALAIGYGKLETFYSVLEDYMQDYNNPALQRQAIISAGNSQHRRFIKLLLGFLSDKTMRSFAHKALGHYNPIDILPFLTKMSNEKGVLDEILIQLAALAETMDTQSAIDFLFELIQHRNPAVKLKAILILHKMKVKYPHLSVGGKQILSVLMEEADLYRDTLKLSYALQHHQTNQEEALKIIQARNVLIRLLERRLDSILQRIFWLLGLSYPPGTILPLYKDLRNLDPDIRINTVELLDNILDPPLKNVVIPILEIAMMETFADDVFMRLQLVVPTEVSCFESLLKGKDEQLKMAVLSLIETLDNPEYNHLKRIADNENSTEKLDKDIPHAGE
jgi:AAA family ATP:ADP antiporter